MNLELFYLLVFDQFSVFATEIGDIFGCLRIVGNSIFIGCGRPTPFRRVSAFPTCSSDSPSSGPIRLRNCRFQSLCRFSSYLL